MKSKLLALFGLAFGLLAVAGPLFAHHAQILYDSKTQVTLEGTVTKMEWANPHIVLYFDVKDEQGNVTNWSTEFSSPGTVRRNFGWSPETFRPGDRITVTGNPRKDGGHGIWGLRGGDNGVPGIKKIAGR